MSSDDWGRSPCHVAAPPLPQLLLHAPLWSRFFANIVGGLGLGLSKVADPIKEFGKWASEPFTYFKGSDDSTLFRWFVYYSLRVSVVAIRSHMTPLCCILSMTLCMTQLSRCSHYVDDDDTRSVRRYQLCTNNSVWTRNTYTRNDAACHVSRSPRHVMVVTAAVWSATVGCRLGRMNIYGIMIVDDYKIIC